MGIERASREKLYLRMAIQGPSGSGKTATALITASAFAKHFGGKVGMIDTQNRQSLDYVGTRFAPEGFDVFHLQNGNPDSLRNAVKQFHAAGGYAAIVIDSLSIAWAGEGGLLDISAESDRKESFSKWNDLNKTQNKLLGDIMKSPCHVIATIQSKTDWLMESETGADGKKRTTITKVGLAPVQKKGIEYFWSLYCTMDMNHNLTIERINAFEELDRQIIHKPDETWVEPLIGWLEKGESKVDIEFHGRKASAEQLEEYYNIHLKHGRGDRRVIDAAFFNKYGSKPEDCEVEFFEERLEDLRNIRVVRRPEPKTNGSKPPETTESKVTPQTP